MESVRRSGIELLAKSEDNHQTATSGKLVEFPTDAKPTLCRLACLFSIIFDEESFPMPRLRFFLLLALCGCFFSIPESRAEDSSSGSDMSAAAVRLLSTLPEKQREAAHFDFNDPERLNWHFIPRERNGVSYLQLKGKSRGAADKLVGSGLSAAGYLKILEIRSLEEVLYLFEGGEEEERRLKRHPHKYYLSIFGDPAGDGEWGWRFEGHHISLNYTVKGDQILSSTPEFLGANPGLIDAGPGRSLRVLGKREEIARSLWKAGSDEIRARMLIDSKPPGEVAGPGAVQPVVSAPQGVPFSEMNQEQQALLKDLVGEYLQGMPAAVVRDRMQAISAAGMDQIHFAWWGGTELNEPHHYVVQGRSFIIEYNNTQNSANHVHAMWRNLAGDFNLPASGEK